MKLRLLKVNLPTSNKVVREEAMEDIGISAGICYMPEDYNALINRGSERNIKTAKFATGNGHHSVADHVQVSFIIEDCSKILAMLLNSLGCYGTSEKSGRYTVMKNCSQIEQNLYNKWVDKLRPIIMDAYPNRFDAKQANKLAMENARLFLSVFAPSTTMKYTVSLKDANYIIDWCERFASNKELPVNYFFNTLKEELSVLGGTLKELVYIDELRDHKGRKFDFIVPKNLEDVNQCHEFGLSYTTYYEGSFAMVAQAERHRTLKYSMYFDGLSKEFYVPEIIEDSSLKDEWLNDMLIVQHLVPQGTIVGVREQGTLEYFKLKCTERMCGRAQLEIMRKTVDTYIDYRDELQMKVNEGQTQYQEALDSLKEYDSCVRCGFMQCKEPCMWGRKANSRLI